MDPVIWLIVVIGIIVAFVLFLILNHKHAEPGLSEKLRVKVIKKPAKKVAKRTTAKKVVKKKK